MRGGTQQASDRRDVDEFGPANRPVHGTGGIWLLHALNNSWTTRSVPVSIVMCPVIEFCPDAEDKHERVTLGNR
jgi:hypothetical protein